jgi:hypothetical protein
MNVAEGLFEVLIFGSIAYWQSMVLVSAVRAGKINTGTALNPRYVLNKADPQRFGLEIVGRSVVIAVSVAIVVLILWQGPMFDATH